MFKHTFHKHNYLEEPNDFGFSLRMCPDGTIQRYSIHSGNWFTITEHLDQYQVAFKKQLEIKNRKSSPLERI